ncbi:Ammonium transporter 1 member 1 [Diplonema papillatum]|nr:Ammonium transporter 1 member 1 [Diplonema papillatum]|eukprot:gene3257-5100_t
MSAADIAEVTAQIQGDLSATTNALDAIEMDMDVFWLLLGGALVFLMQAGFGLLEAGSVKSTSVVNIIFKNLCDACIGAFFFYMVGYGLAFGDDSGKGSRNAFVGNSDFWLKNGGNFDSDPRLFAFWFFQFAFCATAATIVSGAVAERTQLFAYFVYSAWICGFVYPTVVHWCWSTYGWASPFSSSSRIGMGMIDFAGSGVVHMVGGFAALTGAVIIGPRRGKPFLNPEGERQPGVFRFDEGANPLHFSGHNKVFQVLGMFILWTGWYGFNCVSTLTLTGGMADLAAKIGVTTVLGAAGGGSIVLLFDCIMQKLFPRKSKQLVPGNDDGLDQTIAVAQESWIKWMQARGEDTSNPPPEAMEGYSVYYDLSLLVNGVLAGLVSITAGCAVIEPWAALTIGVLGGLIYYGASIMLVKLRIDDPLDAFAVHGVCGYWGITAVGFFATSTNVRTAYGDAMADKDYYGVFYGGNGDQLGIQVLVGLVIAMWTVTLVSICFAILKFAGRLRVPDHLPEYEGVDNHEHGVKAYVK